VVLLVVEIALVPVPLLVAAMVVAVLVVIEHLLELQAAAAVLKLRFLLTWALHIL
jgi:hypothetical protein